MYHVMFSCSNSCKAFPVCGKLNQLMRLMLYCIKQVAMNASNNLKLLYITSLRPFLLLRINMKLNLQAFTIDKDYR